MRKSTMWWLAIVLSVTISQTLAQQGCPALVRDALTAIGDNCSQLGRNVVCYGNDQVRASFIEEVDEDFFTQPADIAALNTISTVVTTALSLEDSLWGVAVMSLQANVPDTLPGQAVTFILLGDTEIENAVEPDTEPQQRMTVPVFVRTNSNIRSGPSTTFNRLVVAPAQTMLNADALSQDGQWVRVVYNEIAGWIFRDNLVDDPVIATLAPVDPTQRSTMQAFYLRSGIGETVCAEAPQQALLVQGPKNYEVNLTVNGANVNISSSVMFRTLGQDPAVLEITVLDGRAEVLPDIEGGQSTVINEGFRSVFCLSAPDSRGTDGEPNDRVVTCNGTPPQRIPTDETRTTLCALQDVPATLLNYNIDLQCPGDPVPPPPPPPPAPAAPAQPTPPPATNNDTSPPAAEVCTVVSVVGPYGPVKAFQQFFQWLPVPGAQRYELRLYDVNFNELFRVNAGDIPASIIDPLTATGNQLFYFEVFAFQEDRTLCTSGRIGGLPIVVDPPPSFSANVSCSVDEFSMSWNNAPSNATILYEITDMYYTFASGVAGTGSSGSAYIIAGYCGSDFDVTIGVSGGPHITRTVYCDCGD